ncbi:MAG: hypothetical protein ABSB38_05475 [Dehalococcoidia bacterium]
MSLFKKEITEEEASRQFVLAKLQEGNEWWQQTYAGLKDTFGEKFIIQDENMGIFDLLLAKIALHINSLRNLFPSAQSKRIRGHILKYVTSLEHADYTINEMQEYERVYNESVRLTENPIDAIAARLLRKWLGERIVDFEFEFFDKKTGAISPMLLFFVDNIVTEGSGWKIIKDNFNIIEG